ncbi:MAG TPA: Hsp20/alpha crystallin family protein [Paracoccaceae bacterium]|nr:Hsp20/alpha crystallin family protein [Paracoccaceae bacterium]
MTTEVTKTAATTPARSQEAQESTRGVRVFRPLVDIRESDSEVILAVEMPGVGPDDVEIELDRRVLTIRGRGRLTSPEGFRLIYAEYGEGDYERSFTLSDEIDRAAIRAAMRNGLLTLTLPRAGAAKPKRIEVKAA